MSNESAEEPKTTYREILSETLLPVLLAVIGAYAVFSLVMDTAFLTHLYVTDVWFVEGNLSGVEPWMIPADMIVWGFGLYVCWRYVRD